MSVSQDRPAIKSLAESDEHESVREIKVSERGLEGERAVSNVLIRISPQGFWA